MDNKRVQSVAVPTEAPKVDKGMVVRTIIYIVAIVNAIAALFGWDFHFFVDEAMVYEIVTVIFTVGAFASAYWKDNDIKKETRIKKAAAQQVRTPK